MSRVIELQDGLIRDPAYVHEFAKLEEELAKLKATVRPGKLARATPKRTAQNNVPPSKARIA